MSLLLDALNKADQERKRNEATPGINSNHEQVNHGNSHKKTILITAVLVASFMMLLAAIYWLGQRSATPVVTTTHTTATTQHSPPAKSQIEPSKATSVTTQAAAIHAATVSSQDTVSLQDIDTSDENVANLYQQNTPAQNTHATLTISTPTADTPTNTVTNAATGTTVDPTPNTPTSITQFANLPDLHDLPKQVLDKIPTLNYSEHNYHNNGGSVKINGTIHHANDQLATGLVIDKILDDGMILHIDNYSFKMRALNSWVNM